MPTSDVTIYGASDDLIEIVGDAKGCDEYGADDASFVLSGGERHVRIRVWYGRGGVWAIAVSPVDEDVPMLAVTITATDGGYSARAVVEGVTLIVREGAPDE